MLYRETHRIQTKPGAYGLLAGLLVLLFGLVANASCAHAAASTTPAVGIVAQHERAVIVESQCGKASGVLLSNSYILTAAHVVNCVDWPKMKLTEYVHVTARDGVKRKAVLDAFDGARDLARLRVNAVASTSPLTVARTSRGDVVCAVTASPEPAYRCGVVKGINRPRDWGDFRVDRMNMWFGNSGSGVFDMQGRLVGLAVRLHWCNDADRVAYYEKGTRASKTCGANITTIEGPVLP